MEMVTCHNCGAQYPADQPFCPFCRVIRSNEINVTPEKKPLPLIRLICGSILLCAAVCFAVILFSWKGSSENRHPESRSSESDVSSVSRSHYDRNDSPSYDRHSAEGRAQSYLESMSFSREGLISQLEYEGFSASEAERAADCCGADWNEQALKKAQSYLNTSGGFSEKGLQKQLEYVKFTADQASYAIKRCGADWNEQALKKAQSYLNMSGGFSEKKLKEQLEYEEFTADQVSYAMKRCNADWNEQAVKSAKSYMRTFPEWTRSELIDQLEYEGFTSSQASYGASGVS